MKAKTYSYPIMIKESYLDTFGHVNNATYLMLFEEARWDLLTQNGFGLQAIQAKGLGPTILEIKLNFFKELRLREHITIETQIISYEKKIGKMLQKMIRGEEVCCQAEIVVGFFDLSTRKLITPPPEWLPALGILTL